MTQITPPSHFARFDEPSTLRPVVLHFPTLAQREAEVARLKAANPGLAVKQWSERMAA